MSAHSISTYDAAAAALRAGDLRQALYDEGAVLMEKALVNLHGDEHRARRLTESRVFRRDYFRFYEHEVFPTTLAQTLDPFLAAGRLDVVDFGYRVMANLTVDFAGIDRPARTTAETATLVELLRTLGLAATLFHAKGDREAIRAKVRTGIERFDELYFAPSYARRIELLAQVRAGTLHEDALPRDVLMMLIRNDDGIELTRDVLLREMAFFALAGAHTSIHTLSHAMHEILTWCTTHPSDRTLMEEDPFFLQRCVHESMRMHPSSPIALRRSMCPMNLALVGNVEAGDEVTIDLFNANRDTTVFGDDAGVFNPHRSVARGELVGLSFGLGMHACLGRNLAAGVVAKAGTDPARHHYGTVTRIVRTLFDHDAHLDPKDPPRRDTTTNRIMWAYYPVVLQ